MGILRKISFFPFILLSSIVLGSIVGYIEGHHAIILKPLGDIFLNLLLVMVVPLVFFSISSAAAQMSAQKKLLNLLVTMFGVFLMTEIIAAMLMTYIVIIFPPAQSIHTTLSLSKNNITTLNLYEQITNMLMISDLSQVFSYTNLLPLIVIAFLLGLATSINKNKGKYFARFLKSGTDITMKAISYIMYYAPIGFFAYFAVLVGEIGPALLSSYFRIILIYYISAISYFFLAFSFYAYLAGGIPKIKLFWKNIFLPAITAFSTCSSAASIPVNLQAAKTMKISEDVYETLIPIGALLHKDGSVLGAIIKISFLFGIFAISFSGFSIFFTACIIALVVGTVMGAIPSGGMIGELLILSFYGFPPQSLLMITVISLIIDPLATTLNVTGDTVCSLLVDRFYRKF